MERQGLVGCFDDRFLRWYRKRFDDRNPGDDATLSHLEFLHHRGLVVEVGCQLSSTRAAVLLIRRGTRVPPSAAPPRRGPAAESETPVGGIVRPAQG